MNLPVRGGPERRSEIAAEIRARTGIDETMIDRLVRAFYAFVREDELLGPIIVSRVKDWSRIFRKCAPSGHRWS